MQKSSGDLLSKLNSIPGSQPIGSRISSMWHYWQDGLHFLETKKDNINMRTKKKILVFMGVLMDVPANGTKQSDDLLQWSDLLASLTILGHDITVKTDRVELLSLLSEGSQSTHRGCDKGDSGFDMIYIDVQGLQQLVTLAADPAARSLVWAKYSCRLRVLTPFGMDAEFNYGDYSEPLMPGERSQRGPNWNLNLKQFLTKYPLSMDNSFLGFAVKSQRNETIRGKKFMAFVHGDTAREFKAHKLYLKAIYKHMRIHTAVPAEGLQKDLPFIVNHGNINLTVIKELLRKSKLFTGLGSPFEEALALEAVAQGCIFINPKFSYPKNRLNSKALKEVSSSRTLSSQHPYLEAFVGKPLVYTVDIWNKTEVTRTLKDVLKTQAKPFVPFEFSCEGMLERLNAYIENQNFCDKSYHWPVQTRELKISMALPGSSCTEACFKEGLTCEPAYFHVLNSSKIPNCAEAVSEESIVAPAIEEDTSRCVLQQNTLLFSCASQHFNYKRVCPCRPYRQGQIALCKDCF